MSIKHNFVFAGLDDGSVVVWDWRLLLLILFITVLYSLSFLLLLREEDKLPTYTTAWLKDTHTGPVVDVVSLEDESSTLNKLSEQANVDIEADEERSSFQLASMSDDGVVIIWSVIEMKRE